MPSLLIIERSRPCIRPRCLSGVIRCVACTCLRQRLVPVLSLDAVNFASHPRGARPLISDSFFRLLYTMRGIAMYEGKNVCRDTSPPNMTTALVHCIFLARTEGQAGSREGPLRTLRTFRKGEHGEEGQRCGNSFSAECRRNGSSGYLERSHGATLKYGATSKTIYYTRIKIYEPLMYRFRARADMSPVFIRASLRDETRRKVSRGEAKR